MDVQDILYHDSLTTLISELLIYFWYKEDMHEPLLYLNNNLTWGTEFDNGYYLSNIPAGISGIKRETGFYPNPANEFIIINTDENGINDIAIEIIDLNGKSLLNKNAQNNQKIDISMLLPGLYFIKINNGKTVEINKLIVQ